MTHEEMQRVLEGLGDSSDEVASALARAGVKGMCGQSGSCALANHLRSLMLYQSYAAVTPSIVIWTDKKAAMRLSLPPAVQEFVQKFDEGHYPELIWNL